MPPVLVEFLAELEEGDAEELLEWLRTSHESDVVDEMRKVVCDAHPELC